MDHNKNPYMSTRVRCVEIGCETITYIIMMLNMFSVVRNVDEILILYAMKPWDSGFIESEVGLKAVYTYLAICGFNVFWNTFTALFAIYLHIGIRMKNVNMLKNFKVLNICYIIVTVLQIIGVCVGVDNKSTFMPAMSPIVLVGNIVLIHLPAFISLSLIWIYKNEIHENNRLSRRNEDFMLCLQQFPLSNGSSDVSIDHKT